MRVATYEAVMENGQIRLPMDLHLPENAKVFVVVPGVETTPAAYMAGARACSSPNRQRHFNLSIEG